MGLDIKPEYDIKPYCATVGLCSIESANIVGYNTVTIKAGQYNMFSVNFEDISDTEGIDIQSLIPGTTEGLKGGTLATGDQIQVYDAATGNYKVFYLQYVEFPVPLKVNNWKWIDGSSPATYKFKNGDAFWYRSQGDVDVTVSLSGGVSLEASQTIDIIDGYNMIGSAFPANFNPNSLGTEYWQQSGATGGTLSTGDQIQIYDSSTGNYKVYYLQYVEFPVPLKVNNWKWIDGSSPVASDAEVISVGKGAWYKHSGSGFTLTIPSPISK